MKFAINPTNRAPRSKHARRAAGDTGTSFYITRGLPFVTMRQYRERRRDPDSQTAVELARELTRLAESFPRFRLALNQLQHHVLVQVRSQSWKANRILDCVPSERPISMRELLKATGLDFVNIDQTLGQLHAAGKVISCTRSGRPLAVAQGRTAKVYWRRGE